MKRIIPFLLFFVCSHSFAYNTTYNPFTNKLDYVGAQNPSDLGITSCTNGYVIAYNSGTGKLECVVNGGGSGSGDVIGPSSSVDNAIVRFDGTTGKIIQDYTSGAPTISDTGAITSHSTSGGISFFNTVDEVTNFELGSIAWATNIFRIGTSKGGTGVGRDINIQTPVANLIIRGTATGPVIDYDINSSATITSFIRLTNGGLSVATSGNISAVTASPSMIPSGTGSANYRILNLSYTLNGTAGVQSGTGTGIFLNATETTLNGMAHNLIDLQVAAASKFSVTNGGVLTTSGLIVGGSEIRATTNLRAAATGQIYWNGRSVLASPSDGVITLSNTATNDFTRLQLGGTTSSFPSIKRNGTAINFRLADDSADADITAGAITSAGVAVPTISSTSTLTNKRITKRVTTVSDATSITPNTDSADWTYQANTQAAGTLTINADAGTPTANQAWGLQVYTTNAQTASFNAVFAAGTGVTLPTTFPAGDTYYTFVWNARTSKWRITYNGASNVF